MSKITNSIKNVGTKVSNSIKTSAQRARESITLNIQNSSNISAILQWMFINRWTLLAVLVAAFFYNRYYWTQAEYWKERNKALLNELTTLKARTAVLKDNIKKFEEEVEKSKKEISVIYDKVENLPPSSKEKVVRDLIKDLKQMRGIK